MTSRLVSKQGVPIVRYSRICQGAAEAHLRLLLSSRTATAAVMLRAFFALCSNSTLSCSLPANASSCRKRPLLVLKIDTSSFSTAVLLAGACIGWSSSRHLLKVGAT
jgi:hypothetical protein